MEKVKITEILNLNTLESKVYVKDQLCKSSVLSKEEAISRFENELSEGQKMKIRNGKENNSTENEEEL